MKQIISALINDALVEANKLNALAIDLPVVIPLDRPQVASHGDFASSLALKLAKPLKMNPLVIANHIAENMPPNDVIEHLWVQPPGFLNLTIKPTWLAQYVDNILAEANNYGDVPIGMGESVQIEFVSVNPTGPIHVGHTRGAVLGDALANILRAANYKVTKEYYFNDAGNQMETFYKSLHVRYQQVLGKKVTMPDNSYVGNYMIELAEDIVSEEGERFMLMDPDQGLYNLGQVGLKKILDNIQRDLTTLRVEFDTWFKEHTLYEDGQYDKAMAILRKGGHLQIRDGATWFVTSALGEDKDNVLVRSTGVPTYFAADVAYHYNKFANRNFSRVINIWGADHHGHISRMKAALTAMDIEPERLTVITNQMITLKSGNQILRASKRTGDIITLKELLDEVGADACRYFFLARSPESHLEFDLDLAKKESSENPVYYIQYAHARISSILRHAEANDMNYLQGDVLLLTHPAELALINRMTMFPDLIESMAVNLEPHHLPHYAQDLASLFHTFYQQCRVVSTISDDAHLTYARIKLVKACQVVLGRCLSMMGMAVPNHM